MNYQYQHTYTKKRTGIFSLFNISKFSCQTAVVLVIILVMLLARYAKTSTSAWLDNQFKAAFYSDYSDKIVSAVSDTFPDTKEVFSRFITTNKSFKLTSMPIDGKTIQQFGKNIDTVTKKETESSGLVIESKEGEEVKAVFGGTVERIENDEKLGAVIVIDNGHGFETKYGYLSDIKISEEDRITEGMIIGLTGKIPDTKTYGVYFEVLKDKKAVNPLDYLNISGS